MFKTPTGKGSSPKENTEQINEAKHQHDTRILSVSNTYEPDFWVLKEVCKIETDIRNIQLTTYPKEVFNTETEIWNIQLL